MTTTPTTETLSWDWKEQPDLDALAAILARHGVRLEQVDTGSDQFEVRISAAPGHGCGKPYCGACPPADAPVDAALTGPSPNPTCYQCGGSDNDPRPIMGIHLCQVCWYRCEPGTYDAMTRPTPEPVPEPDRDDDPYVTWDPSEATDDPDGLPDRAIVPLVESLRARGIVTLQSCIGHPYRGEGTAGYDGTLWVRAETVDGAHIRHFLLREPLDRVKLVHWPERRWEFGWRPEHADAAVAVLDGLLPAVAELAPEPAGGPGWDRDTILDAAHLMGPAGDFGALAATQLRALLADRDRLAGILAEIGDDLSPTGERPEEALGTRAADVRTVLSERDTARAQLAEVTADRDRWRWNSEKNRDDLMRYARERDVARAEVVKHRQRAETAEQELATARRAVKEVAEDRDDAQDKVESFPDRLASARRDGAADALEEAANDADRLNRLGARYFTAADLRMRAADTRDGRRPVPGAPAPASEEAGT